MGWDRSYPPACARSAEVRSCVLRRHAMVGGDVDTTLPRSRSPHNVMHSLVRVLRSARLRHVSLTWLLSPLFARDTSDRPAVIFQPSDSYTCGAIPLEHRHVSSSLETGPPPFRSIKCGGEEGGGPGSTTMPGAYSGMWTLAIWSHACAHTRCLSCE